MRERIPLWIATLGLAAGLHSPVCPAQTMAERLCGPVHDEEGLPTQVIDILVTADTGDAVEGPGSSTVGSDNAVSVPQGCAALLRCVLLARQPRGGSTDTPSPGDAPVVASELRPPACDRVAHALAVPMQELQAALADAEGMLVTDSDGPDTIPEARGSEHEACVRFLRCLLGSGPSEPDAARGAASEPRGAARSTGWRGDFERICSQTDIAPSLQASTLRSLIMESVELERRIEVRQEPEAKVYLYRLSMCRQLFEFVLELQTPVSREEVGGAGDGS